MKNADTEKMKKIFLQQLEMFQKMSEDFRPYTELYELTQNTIKITNHLLSSEFMSPSGTTKEEREEN